MSSKAFDDQNIVHRTDWKGAPFASCFDAERGPDAAPRVSPLFLSYDVPITCVKCISIEAENKGDDDDDEADTPGQRSP